MIHAAGAGPVDPGRLGHIGGGLHEALGQAALVQAMVQVASDKRLSSVHVTFCTEEEAEAGEAMGLLRRFSQQYHWQD